MSTGPIVAASRSLAPDLARGVMLLVVALSHAPAWLYGQQVGAGGYPLQQTPLDQVVTAVQTTLASGRGYPLFAALYGYGIVRLLERQEDAGVDPKTARGLVRRRGRWLLGFGFVHALLLWSGDILGAYGMVAILLAGVLPRLRGRPLPALVGLSLLVTAIGGAGAALATVGQRSSVASMEQSNPLLAAGERLTEWAPTLLLQPLGLIGAVALGAWAAQRRILDEPQRHRKLLTGTAAAGLSVAVLGGVPMALVASTTWQPEELVAAAVGALHFVSGYGAVGYAALVGLIAARIAGRTKSPLVTALAAAGQRSLTCYLAQALAFAVVFSTYLGGLGQHVGVAAAAGVGVLIWVLTVAAARAMHRRSHRGPAELLLRRLTYRTKVPRTSQSAVSS